jgi:hypothetical protein
MSMPDRLHFGSGLVEEADARTYGRGLSAELMPAPWEWRKSRRTRQRRRSLWTAP